MNKALTIGAVLLLTAAPALAQDYMHPPARSPAEIDATIYQRLLPWCHYIAQHLGPGACSTGRDIVALAVVSGLLNEAELTLLKWAPPTNADAEKMASVMSTGDRVFNTHPLTPE